MPSVPTFWCGDDDRALARAGPSRPDGAAADRPREVGVPGHDVAARSGRTGGVRLEAEPTRWVGQQVAPFSEAPMAAAERPGRRPGQHAAVHRRPRLRLRRDARLAGPGAGCRTLDRAGRGRSSVAKDVWVRSGRADAPDRREGRVWLYEGPLVQPDRSESTLVAARAGGHVLARPVRRTHRGPDPAADRRPRAGGRLPFPPRASRCRLRAGAAGRGRRGVRDPRRSRRVSTRCSGSGS